MPAKASVGPNIPFTRDVLDQDWSDGNRREPSCVDAPHFSGGVEELWILAFFCMPTAIDIALLPITGVHDLCVD